MGSRSSDHEDRCMTQSDTIRRDTKPAIAAQRLAIRLPLGHNPGRRGTRVRQDVLKERRAEYGAEIVSAWGDNWRRGSGAASTRSRGRLSGVFCYLDAITSDATDTPFHLCRLRHFSEDCWSLAFYTYSHEKYEPCVFQSGDFFGTPEDGLDVGAVYLQG